MENSVYIFIATCYLLEKFELLEEMDYFAICKIETEAYKLERQFHCKDFCKEVEKKILQKESDIGYIIDGKDIQDALVIGKKMICQLTNSLIKKEISLMEFETLFFEILSQYGKQILLIPNGQLEQRVTLFDYIKTFVIVFTLKISAIEKGNENCLLFNIDISDHKQFYYDGMRIGNLAGVHFRWNYYELIRYFAVREFLRIFDLSGFFCIYSGGKHTYVVCPENEPEKVYEFIETYKNWMIEHFDIELYLSLSVEIFSLEEILEHGDKCVSIFSSVTAKNIHSEYQRYTNDEIDKLSGKSLKEYINYAFCFGNVVGDSVFAIYKGDNGLPVSPDFVLSTVSYDTVISGLMKGKCVYYLVPKFDWMVEKSYKCISFSFREGRYNSISCIEENGQVGVARFDIDNSRKLLTSPCVFSVQKNNVLNLISFSDELDEFMKNYVPDYILSYSEKYSIDLLYLGADDFSIIGNKRTVLDFSVQFCKDMYNYSNGRVSFSAGVCVCSTEVMLETMINKADELLWKAKREEGKASIVYQNESGIETVIRWKERDTVI